MTVVDLTFHATERDGLWVVEAGPALPGEGMDLLDGATWLVGWWLWITAAVVAGLAAVLVLFGLRRILR